MAHGSRTGRTQEFGPVIRLGEIRVVDVVKRQFTTVVGVVVEGRVLAVTPHDVLQVLTQRILVTAAIWLYV